MVTVRFSNETGKPLELMVEPWASTETIPAGSTFAIHYPAPTDRDDSSHAEVHQGMIRFWCEGDTYEVDIDGKRILT
jgi:hypothetical protein